MFLCVLYASELREQEMELPKEEHYIYTAMDRNGFRLVVTMHPYIAMFILSLTIDYTFKCVEGNIANPWILPSINKFLKNLC